MIKKELLTLVGNGKMAFALAQGLKNTYDIELVGRDSDKLQQFEADLGVSIQKTLFSQAQWDQKTVILCVKPANLEEVSTYFSGKLKALYSILAGTSLVSLRVICAEHYVRAMPNLAAEHLLSMTSIVGDVALRNDALELFSSIGMTLWLESEKELDIATSLAGSGPAYLALIAEALTDGAVREGLKRNDAMTLMRGLFKGFGELIQTAHPALLKDSVMSPGGTTASGYGALERAGVRSGCMEAVRLGYERTKMLK